MDDRSVLVVGAGAVGQVLGLALQRSGARVSFLVKPAHLAWCRRGFSLHRQRRRRACESTRLGDVEVLSEVAQASVPAWDQIWLTMSSDALRTAGVAGLLAAQAGRATIVALQPDLDDRPWLLERVEEEQLVQGLVGFLSYQSPLPGDADTPPGVAYALLPGLVTQLGGEPRRARSAARALAGGGLPARSVRDLPQRSAVRSAASVPVIAGLEIAGWSLSRLVQSPELRTSLGAAREAQGVVAARFGRRRSLVTPALRSLPVGAVLRGMQPLVPIDLEAYLRFHFTKVGPQTRLMLDTWCRHGTALGCSVPLLAKLRECLAARETMPRSTATETSADRGARRI